MKRSLLARFPLPLCALIGALVPGTLAAPPQSATVAGEILVRPRATMGAAVETALAQRRLAVRERSPSGLLRVRVPAGAEDRWLDEVRQLAAVAYVERNGIGQGGAAPNDTWFDEQWHLANTGQGGGTVGADIGAVAAWDITTGSRETVIAILDSGLDLDHPEFVGRIDPDGWDFVGEDSDPASAHPHGTQVAGCAAASGDNDFGVSGVDRGCRILPIRVLDQNNLGTTFDLVQGLEYAAGQADVDIVSLSLINYPGNLSLLEALVMARDAGKIVIACAGNNGIGNADVSQPGACAMTISVGATDRDDQRWSGSGTGMALDLVAPGRSIVTAVDGTSADVFTTVTGCSFATPVTAGIAGLLLARAEELDVDLDHDAVQALLSAGAEDQVGPPGQDPPGPDDAYGAGRVNAEASLLALEAAVDCEQFVSIGLPDCDGDGVPDACAIADGAADCNANGLPDACETGTPVVVALARRGPVGVGIAQRWIVADPRPAADTVRFIFTARADLDASFEFLRVHVNGVLMGTVFGDTGTSCESPVVNESLVVEPFVFNAAMDGVETLEVEVTTTNGVSVTSCNGGSFVEMEIAYTSAPTNDFDNDGIPNECEPCPADVTGDGLVAFGDLTGLLNAWGPCPPGCAGDLNADGDVGFADLGMLLVAWGACP